MPPKILHFPLFLATLAFLAWSMLRVLLWWRFAPATAAYMELGKTFLSGIHLDLVTALVAALLLIGVSALLASAFGVLPWLVLKPVLGTPFCVIYRRIFAILIGCGVFIGFFLLVSEWYFFVDFDSRFNTVAIDYLIYPHEVFTNIWESYPVVAIVVGCLAAAGGVTWAAYRYAAPVWTELPGARRIGLAAGWLLVAGLLVGTVMGGKPAFSRQRVINELANNGWASAVHAAWTRNLEYSAFYPTIDTADAFRRVRKQFEAPGISFRSDFLPPRPAGDDGGAKDPAQEAAWLAAARDYITKRIPGDFSKPKLNVCIILEESFGSEFFGVLGRKNKKGRPETLTPQMDALAAREGMLFTSIFADGNRTIRGFEAVFSSFPPLPGDSILARDRTENVETLARVLKRDGYQTVFVYGGRGTFDYITNYTLPNGWDRLVEQKHFENPSHTTAWGVSDEDVLNRGIAEMRALHATGKPFLVSFMTVSNHLPFTYPAGRIAEDPNAKSRKHAVKYADWALGDFFQKARSEPFWTDTIFVVVADHGARVYGSQSIPMKSYEIPLLIVGPAVVGEPKRIDFPGCQLDVAPTVLGLIGRPYESLFFGHDLLRSGADHPTPCLMHHNRSIAVYRDGMQVVFGLNKSVEYWQGNPHHDGMALVGSPTAPMEDLATDGISLFQVADLLYTNRLHNAP